jgi:hypothetical protein
MRALAITLVLAALALPDVGANAQPLPFRTIQPPPPPGMPPPSGTYREPASAGIPPLDYSVRSQRPPKKRKKQRR